MKKLIFLLIFISSNLLVYSQDSYNSITFSGGVVGDKSYGIMANYTYTKNNSNYEIAVLHSMFEKDINDNVTTKFSETTLNLGYLHTILRSRDNSISINFGLGVFGGYQNIPKNSEIIILSKDGPIYGLYAVGQINFYTSDNFAFVLRGQQNYNVNSDTGNTNPYLAFGLEFNF